MRNFYLVALQKIFFLFFLFSFINTQAQVPVFNWAKQAGDSINDIGTVIAKDAAGNVYIAGYFRDSVDFDPGPGTFILSAPANSDIFLLKLSAAGNFIWVKQFVNHDYLCSCRPNGIVINNSGEIYITGFLQGSVDFDPGPDIFLLQENSYTEPSAFVVKLDGDGNLIWAEKFGAYSGTAIALDTNQQPVVTGLFEGTADFDPGPGSYPLTEAHGLFIMRLKSNGALSWARGINSNYNFGDNVTYGVATDAEDNVYFTGSFSATIDADPGPGVFNLTAAGSLWGQNSFLIKLNATGDFQWAKQVGVGGDNRAYCMAVRTDGNICIGGYYNGAVDFDPGPGTFILTTAANNNDGFLMELDTSGNLVWAKNFQSTGTGGGCWLNSIKLSADNDIYAAGSFSGPTVDFDPGTGTYPLGTGGYAKDGFVMRLDSAGGFRWVGAIADHGTAPSLATDQVCNDLVVDASGSVFFTGFFWARSDMNEPGTADFDPCSGIFDMTPFDYQDIFIARWDQYNPATASVTITPDISPVCAGSTVTFTATPVNAGVSPAYQWQVNGINTGTNSNVFSSNSLANGDQVQVSITTQADCAAAVNISSNIIVVNIINPVTPAVTINSPSIVICAGAAVTFTATPVNPGNNPIYQWKKNAVAVGTNSPVYTDNAVVNGDVIQCKLTSNADCITNPSVVSNSIPITVMPVTVATINLTASATEICAGEPVTFTANTTNAGSTPQYQWKKNGVNVGTNNMTYADNNLADGDQISCDITTAGSCVSPSTLSASIDITVHPLPDVLLTATATLIDEGSTAILTAGPSTANQLSWYHNGIIIPSATGNSYTVTHDQLGEYFAVATDLHGCNKTSNKIVIGDTVLNFSFISPNPNHGSFIVRYVNKENLTTRYITIWDSKGAKVYERGFVVSSRDGRILLDLKNVSEGTYFIRLSDKDKRVLKSGKVIIK